MTSGILIQPDSVVLKGPSELLSAIDSIGTKKITKKNIEESFEEEIGIQAPDSPKVMLSSRSAIMQVAVEEFTQKQITVPVQLINAPSDSQLRLIPENIIVKESFRLLVFHVEDPAFVHPHDIVKAVAVHVRHRNCHPAVKI